MPRHETINLALQLKTTDMAKINYRSCYLWECLRMYISNIKRYLPSESTLLSTTFVLQIVLANYLNIILIIQTVFI